MKKQMIAVAVAAVFAAPMAMADAEVYGLVHLSAGQTDNNATEGARLSMHPNSSNVGFRGSEDLGNGLKAEFQAETGLNWDTGGWGAGRDTFVGLAGDWGAARMGRGNSPFKMATNSLDPFADTFFDYNNIMGISENGQVHDNRISNAIWYNSPNMNGLSFSAMYGLNDRTGAGTTSEPETIAIGGSYKAGPFFVGAGYQVLGELGNTKTGAVNEDDEAMRIGASYTIKEATTIGLAYENVDSGQGDAAVGQDRDAAFVAVTHKMGATTLAVTYAKADKVADTADTEADQVVLGVMHALSKATSVYGAYGQLTSKTAAPAYTLGLGSLAPTSTGGDEEATGLLVGVVHKFSSK